MTFWSARRGAAGSVAPFALALCLYAVAGSAGAGSCPAERTDERVRVVHVYDGDTVRLADGRRLRLIGINAPETGRDGQAEQPFAGAARHALQALLDDNNRTLLLQHGAEDEDRYGRLLAHAWTDGGDNVGAHLLTLGLATALVVPPNTRLLACFERLEVDARRHQRGLWAHPRYQSRDSTALTAEDRGFTIVYGRVRSVEQHGGTLWLRLDGPLSLRVSRKDQVNFPAGMLERLPGRTVETRGWIRQTPSGLQLSVRHPAALVPLELTSP